MRIAIITYSRAYNYGSSLQTYALNRYLNNQGFEVKTIDYTTTDQQNLYRIFESPRSIMSIARNVHSLLLYKQLRKHIQRFDSFLLNHVPFTEKIESEQQFGNLNQLYDEFICGSDQIWNANCADFDSNYMLSFVEDKNKCIAYAPSLGAGGESESTLMALRKFVSVFKALSSREQKGAEIISNAVNRNVSTVADPVFLLSDTQWMELTSDFEIDSDYILGYFIGDRAGMREFAHKMSNATGMPVIVILKNLRDLKYGFTTRYDCGPGEFLSLIRRSKGIVTNSFHAVAFSLIFKKDFWAFTGKANSDSRITGILEFAGLKQRIVDGEMFETKDYLNHIRYEDLDMSRLNAYIESSKVFLNNNLR